MDLEFMYGLCHHMSIWSYVVVGFLMVQVTMMAVTLYLHRDAAHRGVDLHPVLRHFFRFWIWATSGMITAEWVAVHRKHHAFSDVDGDPHSPVMMGLRKILLQGAEVYRDSARDPEIVANSLDIRVCALRPLFRFVFLHMCFYQSKESHEVWEIVLSS